MTGALAEALPLQDEGPTALWGTVIWEMAFDSICCCEERMYLSLEACFTDVPQNSLQNLSIRGKWEHSSPCALGTVSIWKFHVTGDRPLNCRKPWDFDNHFMGWLASISSFP